MSIENERKITILHNSIGSNKQIVVKNGAHPINQGD